MKTKLLLIAFIIISLNAGATHLRGGDITNRLINASTLTFEATITTYTKVTGISNMADRDSIEIFWGDGNSDIIVRVNGPDLNPPNGIPDGELVTGDYKINVYIGIHSYAGTPPPPANSFIISYLDQNRIDGISNIDDGNSLNIPFYIESAVFISNLISAGNNTSPQFTSPAIPFTILNKKLNFNSGAWDADGDSMYFELVPPLRQQNMDVPLYKHPGTFCHAFNPANTFQINQQTGHIYWSEACFKGLFNIGVRVKEYRCGVLLSTIMRDMMIVVSDQANRPPVILTAISDTILLPGQLLQFNVSATDSDVTQSLSLQLHAIPDTSVHNGPAFTSTMGNPATGTFTWQPGPSSAQKCAYIFSVRAEDNYIVNGSLGPEPSPLSDFSSFRVWVADTSTCLFSAIEDISRELPEFSMYPNPSPDFINIISTKPVQQVIVYDITGKALFNSHIQGLQQKINIFGYQPGIYLVKALIDDIYVTRKFVKPGN